MGGDDAQEKRALQQFKEALRDIWQEKFTDPYLLRWLRARDFDVTKAEELLRKNLRWREENKVDTLIERYECHPVLKKYFPGGIFNHDRDGCPVYIVPVGHGDFRVLELMRSLTALYENNYPETLKIGLLINTPSFFPIFWKIVRPFITARTANKLHMFTRDGWQDVLLKHVDRSQLPAHWGGTIVDPVGGARCTQVIGPGGELPATVWRGGGGLATDPEAVNCFLERGRSIEVPVQVEAAGAELHWRFQARDVAFALWRTSGESRVQVLAPRRIACDRDAECGQMQCDEPGTYTFLFDNSFSWFTGKQLSYVIRVHHESFASVKATIQC
ncbi:SEC14-like protein 2 isoform X2 [Dermacentor albipictus]|uniref:SEC14-like protein 2 isoform X2 n=1 Tax=Dermacentor albipictus TaxID=60249 RepID=UPI0031FD2E9E